MVLSNNIEFRKGSKDSMTPPTDLRVETAGSCQWSSAWLVPGDWGSCLQEEGSQSPGAWAQGSRREPRDWAGSPGWASGDQTPVACGGPADAWSPAPGFWWSTRSPAAPTASSPPPERNISRYESQGLQSLHFSVTRGFGLVWSYLVQ